MHLLETGERRSPALEAEERTEIDGAQAEIDRALEYFQTALDDDDKLAATQLLEERIFYASEAAEYVATARRTLRLIQRARNDLAGGDHTPR
ncbi:MAG: hypothetical protein ACM3O6_04030 [Acidobacteriota bacterium]